MPHFNNKTITNGKNDMIPVSDYIWCMKCEQAYKRGDHLMEGNQPMCSYSGCSGTTLHDAWDWDKLREPIPQYPETPEHGVKYPMYPKKIKELSTAGQKILELLVYEMNRGRFRPYDTGTYCGYKELHDILGLPQKGPHWGKSLENQGLADLAKWIFTMPLPAITGLIVGEAEPRLPGKGYYEVNDQPEDSVGWWKDQVIKSISFDWSPWVPDTDCEISISDLSQDSLSYLEGSTSHVTREVKARCNALRKRAKELFRDPDGFLRCKVCNWHKPDHRISGDIVELHHIDPIAEFPDQGRMITIAMAKTLLTPVCPNCHRMIHARTGGGQFQIESLRKILNQ